MGNGRRRERSGDRRSVPATGSRHIRQLRQKGRRVRVCSAGRPGLVGVARHPGRFRRIGHLPFRRPGAGFGRALRKHAGTEFDRTEADRAVDTHRRPVRPVFRGFLVPAGFRAPDLRHRTERNDDPPARRRGHPGPRPLGRKLRPAAGRIRQLDDRPYLGRDRRPDVRTGLLELRLHESGFHNRSG